MKSNRSKVRCPTCGRHLIIFRRRYSKYYVAVCTCGLHVQDFERSDLLRKIEEMRKNRK